MNRPEALELAIKWAKAAEHAAQDYPHVPTADAVHLAQATAMAQMWTGIAQELFQFEVDDTGVQTVNVTEPWL